MTRIGRRIGLRLASGTLTDTETVAWAEAHGGLVSYRNNPDGTQSAYGLSLTYANCLLAHFLWVALFTRFGRTASPTSLTLPALVARRVLACFDLSFVALTAVLCLSMPPRLCSGQEAIWQTVCRQMGLTDA